jgi:hypothetical protein
VNGATNIYKIAYNVINNKKRQNYLSSGLDEPVKLKFTSSEGQILYYLFLKQLKISLLNLQGCKGVIFQLVY